MEDGMQAEDIAAFVTDRDTDVAGVPAVAALAAQAVLAVLVALGYFGYLGCPVG
jgi:hypothetical protein